MPLLRHAQPTVCELCFADPLETCQREGLWAHRDDIWLVSFMDYDLGFFDEETTRLEPISNPFEAKVLPMCPE